MKKAPPFAPPVPITPSIILNRANAHHRPRGGAVFRFNRGELIKLVGELVAISQGAPIPPPAPPPWHFPPLHTESHGQEAR